MKKLIILLLGISLSLPAMADSVWINDLRNLFLSNGAIIYAINIRTFNAQDTNKNGIIDEDEESGNFLNAIGRLDEIQAMGINTLHLLPIMEVGQTHALGTAGSLYAAASFNKLNPQFNSRRTMISLENQAIKFINEAHRRGIRIIIDVPACGSYDLYASRPELFLKDETGRPITPAGWKDVLVLNGGTDNAVNQDVYNLYKEFVDYAITLGADGIRADVAQSKPAAFWKELIDYSRRKDPQFMWLAESSQDLDKPIAKGVPSTPYNKLLEAGFDGFYGNYFDMKNWKNASELTRQITFTNSLKNKYPAPKSVIGSFNIHDELSPILINGTKYSEMITWLNSTLPLNAYYVDGFPTGDTYTYLYGNKKARSTSTDDTTYLFHRGKIDIFNFSRQPGGKEKDLLTTFMFGNKFKITSAKIIANGKYTTLKSSNNEVFAYSMSYDKSTILVFGNMNFRNQNNAKIKVPHFKPDIMVIPVKIKNAPITENGAFTVRLEPGEIQVMLINDFEI